MLSRKLYQQKNRLNRVYYGISLSQEKNYTDAIVSYSQAIQISPECIEAFVARGAAHANMHHWEDAVKDLKRALELDPKCENAKKYLQEVEEKIHVLERERNSAERGEYLMELEKPISLKKEPEKLGSVAPLWGRGPQAPSESFVPLNFEPVSSSSSEGDDKSDESNENRKRSKKKGKDDRKERKKKKKRRNYSDEDESGSDGCVKRSKKKHKKKKKK
ncbi:hypothetical protein HK098_001104 [Nowakowskiella sp. JEL0407]|nr:hypothetical protein HK098_001104 [Nowakowskiella sp. JEL0407]